MHGYLNRDVVKHALVMTDPQAFAGVESLTDETLWELVEYCLVHPMYREPKAYGVYNRLFGETWPTDIALSKFNSVIAIIDCEPLFMTLGENRYKQPAEVHIDNNSFRILWSDPCTVF